MRANPWGILGVLFLARLALGYQFQAAGSVAPLLVRDLAIAWADVGMAAPVVGSLVAESLRPETRGPGLGIYYLWYYAGCATLPAVAGMLKDAYGTGAAVWFAVVQLVGTLILIGAFRVEQRRLAPAKAAVEAIGAMDQRA